MDKATIKKYNYWQWRTLIILMIGYALFYFVRKNFSIAMPALESELGLSKTQLGVFLTLNGVIYGVSRFINGMLADRFSRKRMMA
ncbi:MAG: MFS transporter, partial [Bacteroidales bacterium]|nr:MFS transporter [Bacteroidales bacterium]